MFSSGPVVVAKDKDLPKASDFEPDDNPGILKHTIERPNNELNIL